MDKVVYPKPTEMTSAEKEKDRALRMQVAYCELIQYELQRLTEDQLFKILVLIKNTIDENQEKETRRKPFRNKALFPIKKSTDGEMVPYVLLDETNKVKNILVEKKLTGGYGIFSMSGYWSNSSATYIAMYICFCIPDVIDGMIEVQQQFAGVISSGFVYILTTEHVDDRTRKTDTIYSKETLKVLLDNIVKTYTQKT